MKDELKELHRKYDELLSQLLTLEHSKLKVIAVEYCYLCPYVVNRYKKSYCGYNKKAYGLRLLSHNDMWNQPPKFCELRSIEDQIKHGMWLVPEYYLKDIKKYWDKIRKKTMFRKAIKDRGDMENFRLEIPKDKINWKNY